jgi:predicted DNA-binding transcriptional regulator AlpA
MSDPNDKHVSEWVSRADELIDEARLAAQLSVSRSTLQSWRYAAKGPRFIKIGRLIRYRAADVDAYLRAQTRAIRLTRSPSPVWPLAALNERPEAALERVSARAAPQRLGG